MALNPLTAGLPAGSRHPGAFLREVVLPGADKTVVQMARDLGVTRGALINVLDGKSAVTPAMALRLAKLLGNDADFWLRMQAAYDLQRARKDLAEQLEAIPTWSQDAA